MAAAGGSAAGAGGLRRRGDGPPPEEPEEPEVTVLTYAILDPKSVNNGKIDKFNRTHKDVRIVTKNYVNLSEDGKQGADLLTVELATGKVPDIIDFGSDGQLCQLPYRSLAEKGYLEDLWEAFAALPEGDTVLDNVTNEGIVPSMRQYLLPPGSSCGR